ncbi:MAG: sodium/solute symporter [Ignavibacteriaceae bacterium]|nr:sodium/solute symporter [Ignavibacteriaceae bacterium]
MSHNFSLLDILILFFYLVTILVIAFYSSRKKDKDFADYFLSGKSAGWVAIGMALFATNISSEHFIGLAGSGAARGLAVAQFELMAIFILIILGWFIAPIYIKSGVTTVPELFEKRFDSKSRKFLAGLSIGIYFLTKIMVTLLAGGLLFSKMFGLSIYTFAILTILITGIYTIIGGATVVLRTQVVQSFILIFGAVLLTAFGLHEVGGYSGLKAKLPADYFNMFKPISDPDFPWTGIIFGAPIIAFWYWCTDQYIVQRILGAKSIEDARRGSLLAALLKVLPLFILVIPGLIAIALFPEIIGDEAYPTLLSSSIIPIGVKGLIVAGLLSAIMSSLSGVFNTIATLFVNDFYRHKHTEANERKLVLVGRLATTVVVVLAILCVPLVKAVNSQMYLFLQSVQAFVSPPIAAVFFFGIISKKIKAKAAFLTLLLGEAIGLSRFAADLLIKFRFVEHPLIIAYSNVNFLHFAIFLFLTCAGMLFLINFALSKKMTSERNYLSFSLKESIQEIQSFKKIEKSRTSFVISGFILLIIIGVWSLWS